MTPALDDIEIAGDVPITDSVKLNGPPGTGKTTQSAARVAKLIRDEGYGIADVAWATYRRSLAEDTLRRLADWGVIESKQLENPRSGPTRKITTIHALAHRITPDNSLDIAQPRHKRGFCKQELNIRYSSNEKWQDGPGELLFRVFDWLADNLKEPSECTECPQFADLQDEYPGYLEPHTVARLHEDWIAYKEDRDLMDFHEMLEEAYYADEVPTERILVVDEYHDATPLMDRLIRKWADAAEITIVAGDPLQVVNAYQGASPEHFKGFDAPEVLLPHSYRVPSAHWERATEILSAQFDAPDIGISTQDDATVSDFGHRRPFSYDEYKEEWTYPEQDRPSQIVDEYGANTMFLTRTRRQAAGIADELKESGVIFESPQGIGGWNQAEKRLELYNALQSVSRLVPSSFDGADAHGFGQFSDDAETSPSSVVLSPSEAVRLLNHAQASHLAQTRKETNKITDRIDEADSPVAADELNQYVKPEFWSVYTRAEGSVRALIGLNDEKQEKVLRRALEANDSRVDAQTRLPRVYTIHASKGAEAETVVVYDGVTKRIQKEMLTTPRAKRNEHRVWYVALTRASKNLLIARGAFESAEPFIPKSRRASV
jgi:DNA helicase-2/ATP-dependent DNA helicase PcrA